jgi:hypothetical protein
VIDAVTGATEFEIAVGVGVVSDVLGVLHNISNVVEDSTMQAFEPIRTLFIEAFVKKPVPLIDNNVPPARDPEAGVIEVMLWL